MTKPRVLDADFTVIQGHRLGDPHPLKPRWRYAGVDEHGRELWFQPPRFTRWQLFPIVIGALFAAWVLLALIIWTLHPQRPY